jgi:hypothetical protein
MTVNIAQWFGEGIHCYKLKQIKYTNTEKEKKDKLNK